MHIYSFNDIKFTLQLLKRSYMFRSYDHPQGAYIVPCYSYSLNQTQQYGLTRCAKTKQLKPNYINIKINGQKPQDKRTTINALKFRINQEIKFLYHNHWVFLNYNYSKEQCMLAEGDCMFETCRSVLSALM